MEENMTEKNESLPLGGEANAAEVNAEAVKKIEEEADEELRITSRPIELLRTVLPPRYRSMYMTLV